ncbi:hypothetical protein OG782_29910 [Streptomyces sp. NBC_00876]|uniref:hypothetical protein n=1 Tax=Streptomyces sp. NBC_00876 TaxID=2975853 RepID=UPI0038675096|nr:hypothetical protein OG782_29910 [Streptomyces sp. NBC_00876]
MNEHGNEGTRDQAGGRAGGAYCETPAASREKAAGPPYAECVQCRKPTEYAESVKGITLCPVCEWQEAQRTACSG